MPFPRNPDFVGRTGDLEALHAALQTREQVGIRPAGLTGMGGIGKTQLAVEYVYQCKERHDYPDGIFWVNAAEPLSQGLALIGSRLRPEVRGGEPLDRQLRVAFEDLPRRSDALLVFDNLADPAQLDRPVEAEASPLTLGCRILFTTRQHELGRFHAVEVSVLPEEPALQLLLSHPPTPRHSRRPPPFPNTPRPGRFVSSSADCPGVGAGRCLPRGEPRHAPGRLPPAPPGGGGSFLTMDEEVGGLSKAGTTSSRLMRPLSR